MRSVRQELVQWRFRRSVRRAVRPESFRAFGAASLIHPPFTVNARDRVTVGDRTYVLGGAWLAVAQCRPEAEIRIGSGTYLGRDLTIHCAAEVLIGDDVMASDRVYITDVEAVPDASGHRRDGPAAPVSIGSGAFLGTGATVLPGVSIGSCALVAAGAVVTSDAPPNAVVAGNPARVIRHYDHSLGRWCDGPPGAPDAQPSG